MKSSSLWSSSFWILTSQFGNELWHWKFSTKWQCSLICLGVFATAMILNHMQQIYFKILLIVWVLMYTVFLSIRTWLVLPVWVSLKYFQFVDWQGENKLYTSVANKNLNFWIFQRLPYFLFIRQEALYFMKQNIFFRYYRS